MINSVVLNRLYLYINLFITFVLSLLFVGFLPNTGALVLLFWVAAALSTTALLYLIIFIVLRPFFQFRFACFIAGLIYFLVDFALISDYVIYKIWHFHINAMVLNIITSPASLDSFKFNATMLLTVAAILLVLIVTQVAICIVLKRYSPSKANSLLRVLDRRVAPLILLISLVEKFGYGFADIKANQPILESVRTIPLYQPLTFSKTAAKFGIKKVYASRQNSIVSSSKVNYPLRPIEIDKDAPSPNIFIFLFDAARYSSINKETTPNIYNFSKDALNFTNHISGGDATRFGIFSLIYGLNATYWFSFLSAHKGAVLFDVLKQKGYQIAIISATNTKWPEFRECAYCDVQDSIYDKYEGSSEKKDRESLEEFKSFVRKANPKKPIFALLFLDSPHAYTYEKEYEKFKPNAGNEGINYLEVNPQTAPLIKNSYLNALHYDDALFGEAIEKLKSLNLYKNSIILFSSDHGQEFYEYGFFGHNSSFSEAQIHTPFILKTPNKEHCTIKRMTSHLDFVPTLLHLLGVKNPPSDYSNGYNLFAGDYNRSYSYVAKWNKNAIVTKEYTYIFSNLPNELFKNEIRRNSDYKKVPPSSAPRIDDILIKVLDENRRFLK